MEDNDGSSKAAQSAPSKSVANFNFSEKLIGLFSRKKTDDISETNDEISFIPLDEQLKLHAKAADSYGEKIVSLVS